MRYVTMFVVLLGAACSVPLPATNADGDRRAPVVLAPAERAFVLAEMRQFVEAMRGIVQGIADNDMQRVARAARAVGMGAHRGQFADPKSAAAGVSRKAPAAFKKLGFATHAAFDEMARHAEQLGDRDHLLRSLAENMGRCVACHSSYRFPESATSGSPRSGPES